MACPAKKQLSLKLTLTYPSLHSWAEMGCHHCLCNLLSRRGASNRLYHHPSLCRRSCICGIGCRNDILSCTHVPIRMCPVCPFPPVFHFFVFELTILNPHHRKWIRGAVVACYLWSITIGLLVAGIVVSATQNIDNASSYRIPIGIQVKSQPSDVHHLQ